MVMTLSFHDEITSSILVKDKKVNFWDIAKLGKAIVFGTIIQRFESFYPKISYVI
jgi:hypothetical protein